jgi:hypothetical protein
VKTTSLFIPKCFLVFVTKARVFFTTKARLCLQQGAGEDTNYWRRNQGF